MIDKIKELFIKYKEVILYLIFGALTTLVSVVSFAICNKLLNISWSISNVISWILAVLFAYITNKIYVFESKNKNIIKEIISFFGFRVLSLIIDMACMYLFINILHIDSIISKIIVQIIVVVLNYLFSKLFIFTNKKKEPIATKLKEIINNLIRRIKNNKKIVFITSVCLVFLLILILNFLTPLLADDFSYSFGIGGARIKSINDIYKFQIEHWLTWGGRSVVHSIAQLLLMFPKYVFNFLNSIVYILLTLLIYKHIVGCEKVCRPDLYIFINILIWFTLPAFGQDILWLLGACNYLWGTTILLAFLLPIRLNIDTKKGNNNIFLIIIMFMLGILAGWTNENNAAALLVLIVLFAAYKVYFKEKLSAWHISGFLGSLIGFIIMIIAPGNKVRSSEYINNYGFLHTIYSRFIKYTNNFIDYLLPAIVILIIISVVAYYFGTHKNKNLIRTSTYFIGTLAAVYSMLLSPTFPDRSWMGPICFLIIAIGNAYICLNVKEKFISTSIIILIPICILSFLLSYYSTLIDSRNVYNNWNNRINYINQEKVRGEKHIQVEQIYSYNKHTALYGLKDLNYDRYVWPNPQVARYFKIDTIRLKDK